MNALIVGRVIAGIGGAGMYLGNLNLLTINTTLRERPVFMGGVGIVWGAGTILGPVIGGSFADSGATWRWVSLSLSPKDLETNYSRRSISIFLSLLSYHLHCF